jgi:hypothetical protein
VLWLGLGLLTEIVSGPKLSCARNSSGNGRAAAEVLPLGAGFVHPEWWAASAEAVPMRGRVAGVGALEPPVLKPREPEPKRRAALLEDELVTWKGLLESMASGEGRSTKTSRDEVGNEPGAVRVS